MYILTDVYGDKVIHNEEYKKLDDAKTDLAAEFYCFTSDDNSLEYGVECFEAEDGMSAWAKLDGKYRVWNITAVDTIEEMTTALNTALRALRQKTA